MSEFLGVCLGRGPGGSLKMKDIYDHHDIRKRIRGTGIFTYIYHRHKDQSNVGIFIYAISGSYGYMIYESYI